MSGKSYVFHPLVVEIMKNDTLILKWIDSIERNYMIKRNLDLDIFILALPKNYTKKIKALSFDYNISKVNLVTILIYNIIKINESKYNRDFIKHIFLLAKFNSSLILSKMIL